MSTVARNQNRASDLDLSLDGADTTITLGEEIIDSSNQFDVAAIAKGPGAATLKAMSGLEDPKQRDRHNALKDALIKSGDDLYTDVFSKPCDGGPSLGERLAPILKRNFEDGRPTIVQLHGGWGSVPLELARLPGHASPLPRPSWLGEFCVFSFRASGRRDASFRFGGAAPFQGVALFGQEIEKLEEERVYVTDLASSGRALFSSPNPLGAAPETDFRAASTAAHAIKQHLNDRGSIHCLSLSAHAEYLDQDQRDALMQFDPPLRQSSKEPAYRVCLDKDCHLFDLDLEDAKFGEQRAFKLHFAYLNACWSYVMAPGAPKLHGLAGFSLHTLDASQILAAMCTVRSGGSARFTKAFLSRFLAGIELGQAVFEARRELLAEEILTGLCYRLVGRHDLALEPIELGPRLDPRLLDPALTKERVN